ncbi:MAG TPA: hypothetical protein VKD72_06585 [Gemmataceae bacterium]|nr:hypothetical protein [Gemmataceae bacterium]
MLTSSTISSTNDQPLLAEDEDGDDISDGGDLRVAGNTKVTTVG